MASLEAPSACPTCGERDRLVDATADGNAWCDRCMQWVSAGPAPRGFGRAFPPPEFEGPPLARGGKRVTSPAGLRRKAREYRPAMTPGPYRMEQRRLTLLEQERMDQGETVPRWRILDTRQEPATQEDSEWIEEEDCWAECDRLNRKVATEGEANG